MPATTIGSYRATAPREDARRAAEVEEVGRSRSVLSPGPSSDTFEPRGRTSDERLLPWPRLLVRARLESNAIQRARVDLVLGFRELPPEDRREIAKDMVKI